MSARRPLGPVADASRYADQLGLWDAPVEEREAILHAYLSEPIGEYCRCGKELIRVNAGSGVCLACMKAMEDEAQDPTHEQRMSSMGVPPAYHHCRLDTWKGVVPGAIYDWIVSPADNLVIFGPDTGCGKTHLATAALYSLQSGGHRCWWSSSTEMARSLSLEEFDRDQPTFKRSSRVEFLLVDDLGSEDKAVVNSGPRVRALLDERHRWDRRSIVTTNLTVEQLTDLDPRLASRLLSGTVIERKGEDKRWVTR